MADPAVVDSHEYLAGPRVQRLYVVDDLQRLLARFEQRSAHESPSRCSGSANLARAAGPTLGCHFFQPVVAPVNMPNGPLGQR
ncbi:unannotated protein [freshwater metagenome]|uniref:Unannotated protein n=1 Tax=freshwater metagenome TaxID=449393 RepID=A0A6J7JM57_9ZZZZ